MAMTGLPAPPAGPAPGALRVRGAGAGLGSLSPPSPAGPPPAPPGVPGLAPDTVDEIIARQKRATAGALGDDVDRAGDPKGARPLSPRAQYQRYKAMTGNTRWVDKLLQEASDPAARFWLGIIKQYGFQGLSDYLSAMAALEKGGG